jgi:hypothetical protein
MPSAVAAMDKTTMQMYKHGSCSQRPLPTSSILAADQWLSQPKHAVVQKRQQRCQQKSPQAALAVSGPSRRQPQGKKHAQCEHLTAAPHQIPDPSSHLLSFSGLSTGAAGSAAGASCMPAYVLSSTTYASACSKIHRQHPRWEQSLGVVQGAYCRLQRSIAVQRI